MIKRWRDYRGMVIGVERRRYGSRWFCWVYYLDKDGHTWRYLGGDPYPGMLPPWQDVVESLEKEITCSQS